MQHHEMRGGVAVVTGAASGIGAAVAEEFAAEGASVVLLDLDGAGAALRAKDLTDRYGVAVLALGVDISERGQLRVAVDAAVSKFGSIDYLSHCAASFIAAGIDATSEQWDRILAVNVRGCAEVTAVCVEHMRPGSAVVNMASVSAHIAQPNRWTYNSTKAAVVELTKCQALDLADRGLRVNCVSPGWIWTPEVSRAAEGDRARWEPVWGRYHLLKRLGEPREVARAVIFLCSSDASFITGAELMVDGGYRALSAEGLGDASQFAGTES